jgi:TRAP-type C4-dicarboxylate transport system permease small subunit
MKTKKFLEIACGLLSALALFSIMALTFFDVLGRKLASNSIRGSLEITELLMVVVIFAALPLVSDRGEHVTFDSLDAYLPAAVIKAQVAVMHVVCGAVLVGLGVLMWKTGNEFLASGETTAQLGILKAPFIWGMGALCAITGAAHFLLVGAPPRSSHAADAGGAT